MNLRFKTSLLEHTKSVGVWAKSRNARATIDAVSLELSVRKGALERKLFPQFVGKRDGRQLVYFDQPDRFAMGFVGWLPYRPQAWDVSTSKLVFKAAARDLDLPTPAFWQQSQSVLVPFLIKRSRGSFGYGMRGPYRSSEASSVTLGDGEFFEEFKWGRIARAWFWCRQLAALEVFDMPYVVGDGVSTYENLLHHSGDDIPEDFALIARLQGSEPSEVMPSGKRVICDYRYVSPFNPTVHANHNLLARDTAAPLVERFAEAGRRFWPRIPRMADQQHGFVLDAIVDAKDKPWFLEVNSNPQWHPDIIPAMLDGIFGLGPTT